MHAALEEILCFGFASMNLNRVVAEVWSQNTRSARFLEKLGFRREGLLRQAEFAAGTFQDLLIYAILKEEFEHTTANIPAPHHKE